MLSTFMRHIFDLDGTLMRKNSFQEWLRFMLFAPLKKLWGYYGLKLKVAVAVHCLKRLLKKTDHQQFKLGIQESWQHFAQHVDTTTIVEYFNQKLLNHTLVPFQNIQSFLEKHPDSILATAASAEYVPQLAQSMGFRHYSCTPKPGNDWFLNVGSRKRISVESMIAKGESITFYTDHPEDIPMMLLADQVIWCGSEAHYQAVLQQHPALIDKIAKVESLAPLQ